LYIYAVYKHWPRIRLYVLRTPDDAASFLDHTVDILVDELQESCDIAIKTVQRDQNFTLLVADCGRNSVWKIECSEAGNEAPVEWLTGIKNILTLSVNELGAKVCMTTTDSVEVYSFSGIHLYSVVLHREVCTPTHSLLAQDMLGVDYLIMSHVEPSGDMKHRVCLLSKEGFLEPVVVENRQPALAVYGSRSGHKVRGELIRPLHLATDENRRVFVADYCNNRVKMLDCRLGSSMILADNYPHPCRLWYDSVSRNIIVGTSVDGIRVIRNMTAD
jgi:hypothetical protein